MSAIDDSTSWRFTPDDGSPSRLACDVDWPGCMTTIDRAGTISAKGYANGGPYSDSRPIHVRIAAPPELTLVCTPTVLLRGESISCTAGATDGSVISVTNWHFVSTDSLLPSFQVDGPTGPAWGGVMAISGVIAVTARVGTVTESKSATIRVNRRDWSAQTVPYTITPVNTYSDTLDVQYPYLDPPKTVHDLGQNAWAAYLTTDAIKMVGDGPNGGLAFFTALPFRLDLRVSYNESSMRIGSTFYSMQASSLYKKGNVTYCPRNRIVDDIALVKKHEGYNISDANSHTDVVFKTFNAFVRTGAESMVNLSSDLNADALRQSAKAEARHQSDIITDATTGSTNPYQTNCVFNYDQSLTLP